MAKKGSTTGDSTGIRAWIQAQPKTQRAALRTALSDLGKLFKSPHQDDLSWWHRVGRKRSSGGLSPTPPENPSPRIALRDLSILARRWMTNYEVWFVGQRAPLRGGRKTTSRLPKS